MKSDPPAPEQDALADDPRASLPARTRLLVAVAAAGWMFFCVRALVTRDYPFSAATGLGALLTLAVLVLLRARPEWTRPLAHVNAAIATLFIFVSCLLSGQVLSASLPFLVCVPLAAGYLQGFRSAALWAAICAATAALNEALMRLAPLRPSYVNSTSDYTIATVVLIGVTLGLVTGSERVHAAHIEALRRRESTIESLMLGLQKKSEEAEQARDRAIEASRAKGDFVATLSHEIRTPLNGVLGMAGLLLSDDLPPQQRELVRTIRTSGDALRALLSDMLDFSKIEAGRIDLERAPFELRRVVQDAFDLFSISAANKGLRLDYIEPPGGVWALGDAGRVRQILVNLVGNAVKFTAQGEIVVEVISAPADGGELHFTVRDTGIGILPERTGALFQPFTQADASTTSRFGGTGLGLAICRRLAEVMGGRAWVESRVGEGSTFHVTLALDPAAPTVTADLEPPGHDVPRSIPPAPIPPEGAPTALVAEDNPVNQRVARLVLERLGYRVDVAGNGREALDALRARRYDVVLMDVRMPEMDGLEATRALRAELPADRQPFVVAMTANVQVEDREACARAGMDAFVAKPFRPADLARVLQDAAARRPRAADPGSEPPPATG